MLNLGSVMEVRSRLHKLQYFYITVREISEFVLSKANAMQINYSVAKGFKGAPYLSVTAFLHSNLPVLGIGASFVQTKPADTVLQLNPLLRNFVCVVRLEIFIELNHINFCFGEAGVG